MKTIYILPAILSLTLLAPSLARASDGTIVYDVSGHKGENGDSGRSGFNRYGNRADDGTSGEKAEDGESAGEIQAEIGFVPGSDGKEVYIKGYKKESPKDRTSTFNETIDTEDLKSIRFVANGGDGGAGGRGGDGERGVDGRHGSDTTYVFVTMDGGDGEDGQNGGEGGDGGLGGRGGNAGNIQVKLAPGAELLAPLVAVVARPGRGGSGGAGGNGGAGGRGGDGGEGICEDGTNNNFAFGGVKTVDTGRHHKDGTAIFKTVRCGDDGRHGKAGTAGDTGRHGPQGSDGASAQVAYNYADGKPVSGGYELRASSWVIDEAIPDGVVEPKEDLRARAVVFENTGKDPVPPANYHLKLANGKDVTVKVDALPAGQRKTVQLENPMVIEAPIGGEAAIPLKVTLDHLDPGVKEAPTFPVLQPVEVVQVNDLDLTSKKREGEISFRIVNRSNKSYGSKGEIARALKLQLQSKSGNPPLVKVDGKFIPLNQALNLDIPEIGAGETRILKVKVRAPENWKPGQDALLGASLSIENSKVDPVTTDPMQVAYRIDRNDKLQKSFSVKDLGVTCQYYRALWFNYAVNSVSVTKPENAKYVEVRVELEGGKMSPVYKIALNTVPEGFLDNVLNERPFTSFELVDFLQGLEHPGKRGLFTDGSRWNIRSCYAAENRRGQMDPESYAAEQASRINLVNQDEDSNDGRVIEGHTAGKYVPRNGGRFTEERSEGNNRDAR